MDGAQAPAKMLQERKPKFFWAQEVQSLPKGTGETRAQLAVQPMQCKPHAIRQTMQEAKGKQFCVTIPPYLRPACCLLRQVLSSVEALSYKALRWFESSFSIDWWDAGSWLLRYS
ncbi:hypothetical protein Y1Q_0022580 [Alligator mississippiensis]|uniref:Uncharacterized protein n=1 Tax=Alligator mississippiensis TaxID=8496 RepID=A0A151NQD5_ALLMI|nr:hypothetical protein Y1Q_0022580 [Alligator mississippiensis]